MLFVFECPTCRSRIEADASVSGRQSHCPQCHAMVAVPESRVDCGATLGEFRLGQRLGKGGMGEVFLGTQLSVDRPVAVKVLPPGFATDQAAVQRFLHEGRLAARLDHANIVKVHEAGVDNGHYYLAMAYVEGESLDQRLKREGALPEREALTIVRTVADALAYAWDEFQLLHRDLKPANLMLDRRGRVFLMDLGLAKSLGEESGMTVSGAILGTPHYMSPEQATGSTQLSVQTDIYALGATLYHLVVGAPPFSGDSALKVLNQHVHEPPPPPCSRNPRVSEACSQIIAVMMAKQPAQRYRGWRELIADLDRVLAGVAPLEPAACSGRAGAAAGSAAAVSRVDLAHQAHAPLARQHRAGAPAKVPAGRTRRSPWVLGLAAAAALVVVLLVALIVRGRGAAAAPQAQRGSPTRPTGPASPTGTAQSAPAPAPPEPAPATVPPVTPAPAGATVPPGPVAPPAVPGEISDEPPAAAAAEPAAAGAPLPPAATVSVVRPAWDRITLPHAGDWTLVLNGKDSHVIIPTLKYDGSHPVTIEAVVNCAATTEVTVAHLGTAAKLLQSANRYQFLAGDLARDSKTTRAAMAQDLIMWRTVHVAGVWDGHEQRLYVNGSLVGTAPCAGPLGKALAGIFLGAAAGPGNEPAGGLMAGTMACFRVSKVARYAEGFDIATVLPFQSDRDTMCLLDLEEGQGDMARDSSGNKHHGYIRGATWRRQWRCDVPDPQLLAAEEALRSANPQVPGLALRVEGLTGGIAVVLSGYAALHDLTPLASLPVLHLDIVDTAVADLAPLRGLRLGWLRANHWQGGGAITDLSPLEGMPLDGLELSCQHGVSDLSPLKGAPLRNLLLGDTAVADLGPLAGMDLVVLTLLKHPDRPGAIRDITPLREMPLRCLHLARCSLVTDLSPLTGCRDLEMLWTPIIETTPPAEITRGMTKLRYLNPIDPATNEAASAIMREIRSALLEDWRARLKPPDKPPVAVAQPAEAPGLASLAKPVLAGRSAEALQRWLRERDKLGKGLGDEQRQVVTAQLEALAGADGQLLASLKADIGKTVDIELAKEKITCEVCEVTSGAVRVNQLLRRQGQTTGKLGRVLRPEDLSVAERLRRLGAVDTPARDLQRGLLALEAGRPDSARKLFAKVEGPLAEVLVAALTAQRAATRSAAAEQAVIELLRQVSTAPKLGSHAKVLTAIRERHEGNLKRLQASQRLLLEFERDWGASELCQEWSAVVREALAFPWPTDARPAVPDIGIELVLVPAGEFRMGSKEGKSADGPVHPVRISQPFWMAKYETTQGDYARAFLKNPSTRFLGADLPVESVSWTEAAAFCRTLTERERGAGRLPPWLEYRLPTEAEWEYAARGGPASAGYAYSGSNTAADVAWGKANSESALHPVGKKRPNELGLYDMTGNVCEWCLDGFDASFYRPVAMVDPVNLKAGDKRVHRGGNAWHQEGWELGLGSRWAYDPNGRDAGVGFRIVLAVPISAAKP